jgi:hypothetical protein
MQSSKTERCSAYELEWSLSTGETGVLKLEYRVEAFEELYIADRLWIYDDKKKRAPDPFGVYRFVHEGCLRLVFAQAPHLPEVMPHVIFEPLFSRIRAGETRRQEIAIKLPVDEYSCLARNIKAPAADEEVSRAVLVIDHRLRSDMDEDPAPPPGESVETAGYVVWDSKPIISSLEVEKIPVKRRTGTMARFALPEDKRS